MGDQKTNILYRTTEEMLNESMGGFEAASIAEKAKSGEIFGHLNSPT